MYTLQLTLSKTDTFGTGMYQVSIFRVTVPLKESQIKRVKKGSDQLYMSILLRYLFYTGVH